MLNLKSVTINNVGPRHFLKQNSLDFDDLNISLWDLPKIGT